jgi:hypothetical protein
MFQSKDVKKTKTQSLCSIFLMVPFLRYGRAGQATDDNIIWRICIACCIIKATNTHSQYVILIALPLRQWLHERVSMLLYIHRLSCSHLSSAPQVAC